MDAEAGPQVAWVRGMGEGLESSWVTPGLARAGGLLRDRRWKNQREVMNSLTERSSLPALRAAPAGGWRSLGLGGGDRG